MEVIKQDEFKASNTADGVIVSMNNGDTLTVKAGWSFWWVHKNGVRIYSAESPEQIESFIVNYENCISHGRVNEIILQAQQRAVGTCWMDALQTVMRRGEIDLCKDKMKQTGKDFYNCLISFRVYE